MGIYIGGGTGDDRRSWSYSYGTFARVRDAIAEAMGIGNRHVHYDGKITNHTLLGYWVNPDTENHTGETVLEPEDDMDFLMLHQDCEGILPYWVSARVAVRLKDLLARSDDSMWGVTKPLAIELMELLEWAGENYIMLDFG